MNLIFSVFKPDTLEGSRKQYIDYQDSIIKNHKEYAEYCGAEYKLIGDTHEYHILSSEWNRDGFLSQFELIQYYKIHLLCEFTKIYNKVLYIDFDVIHYSKENIFDEFNLDNGMVMTKLPVQNYSIDTIWVDPNKSQDVGTNSRLKALLGVELYKKYIDQNFNEDVIYYYNTGIILADKSFDFFDGLRDRNLYIKDLYEIYDVPVKKYSNESHISYMALNGLKIQGMPRYTKWHTRSYDFVNRYLRPIKQKLDYDPVLIHFTTKENLSEVRSMGLL